MDQKTGYREQRRKAVALLGGECVDCGTKNGLEFDHAKATEKGYEIGTRFGRVKFETLLPELKKCVLRCKRCHGKKTKACGEGPVVKKPTTHGDLAMYMRYGCRCEKCRVKYNSWHRDYRRRKGITKGVRAPYGEPAGHGEIRSYKRGCRCAACRAANSETVRNRRIESAGVAELGDALA